MVSHLENSRTATEAAVAVIRHPELLLVLNTDKGRGVYSKSRIPAGTVVEITPVLILPPSDVSAVEPTIINHYCYNWPLRDLETGKECTTQAIALGLGSIFNHSKHQNVGFTRDLERACLIYTTLRDIDSGEELCISYGPRLWFEDVEKDEGDSEDPLDDLNQIQLD